MSLRRFVVLGCLLAAAPAFPLPAVQLASASDSGALPWVGGGHAASIAIDSADYPVVSIAAHCLADDVQRVTGIPPAVSNDASGAAIIAGTLGHSRLIDELDRAGKLPGVAAIRGKWESTLVQMVDHPFPGVDRALVIAGSDRRATAYGLFEVSEAIGVSPWYWWADVRTAHRDTLALVARAPETSAPSVKYRGIFINDEDWGLNPWASKTFDPAYGNIGPKTYAHVFELMLRLRLNYLWPAMHAVTREFGSDPENIALADTYGIVAGASHCEPMLFNNVHWNENTQGPWNYSTNQEAVHAIWEKTATERGSEEAVWTLGIRGIHDAAMETPPTQMDEKLALLTKVITDQRQLLEKHVTKDWGPVAQCFVPYKEVLPIYDAGLPVPDDVTLVWVDDNFGYIRRFSSPKERARSGGSGIYWHLSYYGAPHSYTWINTTAPALIWEELHKAWENEVRSIWIINVGDIKPMEIGIDYFAKLAWNPEGFALGAQPRFLEEFASRTFGPQNAKPIADLLADYYRLGTIHKPELMDRQWATSIPADRAAELDKAYTDLLAREAALRAAIPADQRDAYVELIGFPAQVVGETGAIFMADRKVQEGLDVAANQARISRLRDSLEAQVVDFNTKIAGGKWDRMMPGLETGADLTKWSSQVRWPWGERMGVPAPRHPVERDGNEPPQGQSWRDAAAFDHEVHTRSARWSVVSGLGVSGRAIVLTPADLSSYWREEDASAPSVSYSFESKSPGGEVCIEFLPTFRIYPGMKLRVALSVDGQPPVILEVPGSSGTENEQGAIRQFAVQDNVVRTRTTFPSLTPGKHSLVIRAIDPGVAIDRISLP